VPERDIADAANEVFLVLHRRWNEIDRTAEMRPWLFGVARRIASGLRAKRREEPSEIEPAAVEDPLSAKRKLLWRALADLDEERRTVLILHDLEGHTGAEIATMLEIPAGTVHSRLRLARGDLLVAVQKLQEDR
jgi:RNA polymerase sigma-70 factor (ECF subfamily)